jgi:hypothetical protein
VQLRDFCSLNKWCVGCEWKAVRPAGADCAVWCPVPLVAALPFLTRVAYFATRLPGAAAPDGLIAVYLQEPGRLTDLA